MGEASRLRSAREPPGDPSKRIASSSPLLERDDKGEDERERGGGTEGERGGGVGERGGVASGARRRARRAAVAAWVRARRFALLSLYA